MNPVRAWFHEHRWNPYPWLARIEQVLRHQSNDIKLIDSRLRRLETMQFGYGPPPKEPADPIRIISIEPQRKDAS